MGARMQIQGFQEPDSKAAFGATLAAAPRLRQSKWEDS
jgi:hypothetical protein